MAGPLDLLLNARPLAQAGPSLLARLGLPLAIAVGATGVAKLIGSATGPSWSEIEDELGASQDLSNDESKRARRLFNVLERYAPSMSADPIVASTWIRKNLAFGELAPEEVPNLISAEEKFRKIRRPGESFLNTAANIGKMVI